MVKEKKSPPVPRWHRQSMLSKRWFQVRTISYYILILLGGITGLSFYVYRYARREIRFEMFGGHSNVTSPWEILRDGILMANGVATLAVILVAVITTLVITTAVSRAAKRLSDNLLFTLDGGSARDWAPPSGIYEFQHLHRILAEALDDHHERVDELKEISRILGEKTRSSQTLIDRQGVESGSLPLKDLHVQCEKMKGLLSRFKLRKD